MFYDRFLAWFGVGKSKKRKSEKISESQNSDSGWEQFPDKYSSRSHILKIETINICNAKCAFCAYQYTNREKMYMPPEVFKKVISDYVAIGGGSIGFTPVVGEFLLDPYLFERLDAVSAEPKITDVGFHTNLLDLKKYNDTEVLKLITSIDWLSISTGANAEDYKSLFGVDRFNDLLDGMERLAIFKKNGVSMPVIKIEGRATKQAPDMDSRLKSFVETLLNGRDVAWVQEYNDWGGAITDSTGDVPVRRVNRSGRPSPPCTLPLMSSVVFSNGDVGLCSCADAHASLVIGNVMQQSLGDILSSKKRKDFILGFTTGKIEPCCSACTFYNPLDACQLYKWIEWINPHHFIGSEPIWTQEGGQLRKRKR